jgi:hypothetical protein
VGILAGLAVIAAIFSLYTWSRFVAAKNAEIGEVRDASHVAVAAAEAQAALADERASEAVAVATAAAERTRELEFAAARSWALAAGTTHQPRGTGTNMERNTGAAVGAPEDNSAATTGVTPPAVRDGSRDGGLTPGHHDAMVRVLKAATSPRHISLSWVATTESYAFAKDVGHALRAAGWTVSEAGGLLTPSPTAETSAMMSILSNDTVVLQGAFEAIGLPLAIRLETGIPENEIKIIIGERQ